jgi:hypothetical protein
MTLGVAIAWRIAGLAVEIVLMPSELKKAGIPGM